MKANFNRFLEQFMVDNLNKSNSSSEINSIDNFISNSADQAVITAPRQNFLLKLQQKWGVDNLLQVFLILLTFSLAGSSVVLFRKFLFNALGYTSETAWWIKTITYIIFVFPAYQVTILVYGTLLGQFNFFWEKEKKMARAIKKLFTKRK